MPELPEVETVTRGLQAIVIGKKIAGLVVREKKIFRGDVKNIIGTKIDGVFRAGKHIIFSLSSGRKVVIHLKMTGQLIFEGDGARLAGGHPSRDLHAILPNKHTHLVVTFSDRSKLFFNDLRKFGYVREYLLADYNSIPEIEKIGVDALSSALTAEYLFAKAKKRKTLTIKQLIMDQKTIAGIGNIYADESLHCAGMSPQRKARKITPKEAGALVACIKKTLHKGIKYGGTSEKDYVNIDGKRGKMQKYLKVYRKTGEKCSRCRGEIKRTIIGGRGTHYCPKCQK